jgi:type II secretory pathway pseudopilin PulG
LNSEFGIRNSECPACLPGDPGFPGGRAEIQNSEFRIPNSREAGYTLAIFVMVLAVMAIMMAAAVEIVSFQAQREKEAELIFRGQQYVEGIRLYRQKYGRYPMRMQELWEANPRVLRKKWSDPITGSEKWGVIFKGQEGREITAPRSGPQPTPTRTPVFERQREGEGEKVGPIIGVHSLSTETSIKVYEGRTQYNMWKFVLKDERGAPGGPGTTPTPSYQPTGTPNYDRTRTPNY